MAGESRPTGDRGPENRTRTHWGHGMGAEPGDGPLDPSTVEQDVNSYSHYESPAATQIGEPGDGYDKLREVHEGRDRSDDELPVRQSRWDKKRVTETFCSQLELTEFQRGGIMDAMRDLDFSQFGSQRSIETVALGVIRYVVNKDRTERNPEATWVSHEDKFQELMDDCGVTMSDLTTVKSVALEQIPNLQAGGRVPERDPHLPTN